MTIKETYHAKIICYKCLYGCKKSSQTVIVLPWVSNNAFNSCYGECVLAFNNVIGTVDFLCTLIAPIATIIVLYTRIFSVALSQARAMRVLHIASSSVSVKPQKSELRAAITLGVVVLIFFNMFPSIFFSIPCRPGYQY